MRSCTFRMVQHLARLLPLDFPIPFVLASHHVSPAGWKSSGVTVRFYETVVEHPTGMLPTLTRTAPWCYFLLLITAIHRGPAGRGGQGQHTSHEQLQREPGRGEIAFLAVQLLRKFCSKASEGQIMPFCGSSPPREWEFEGKR